MKTRFILTCISLIGIGAILIGTNGAARINVEDTMGIWLFDEGEGDKVLEYTGNGIDGTFVNNPEGVVDGELANDPEWVDGKFGKAVSLNGSTNYIELNNSLNVETSHSISVWVNPGETQNEYADVLGNHMGGIGGLNIEQRADQVNRFYHGMGIGGVWQGGPPAERPATQLVAGVYICSVVNQKTRNIAQTILRSQMQRC